MTISPQHHVCVVFYFSFVHWLTACKSTCTEYRSWETSNATSVLNFALFAICFPSVGIQYPHLQRTVKVDVDSSAKRCKEKMRRESLDLKQLNYVLSCSVWMCVLTWQCAIGNCKGLSSKCGQGIRDNSQPTHALLRTVSNGVSLVHFILLLVTPSSFIVFLSLSHS